jgi:hypothetical protein
MAKGAAEVKEKPGFAGRYYFTLASSVPIST